MERCDICGCKVNREGNNQFTPLGRATASEAHCVAERLKKYLEGHPWLNNKETFLMCYECHEELLHNPVLLEDNVKNFAKLVEKRQLDEDEKSEGREKIAGRIELFHEVIQAGLKALLDEF